MAMNWYQENRWLGNFLIVFAGSLILALWLLFHARGDFSEASARFNEVANERARLEHLNPFPNEENFRKTQAALENYGASLNKTKEDLKTQVVPTGAARSKRVSISFEAGNRERHGKSAFQPGKASGEFSSRFRGVHRGVAGYTSLGASRSAA